MRIVFVAEILDIVSHYELQAAEMITKIIFSKIFPLFETVTVWPECSNALDFLPLTTSKSEYLETGNISRKLCISRAPRDLKTRYK